MKIGMRMGMGGKWWEDGDIGLVPSSSGMLFEPFIRLYL
jgi:hypothetical protein